MKQVEVRIHQHNLLEVALTRPNTIYDDAVKRDTVVCFITQLERAIEAATTLEV